jgi:predicted ATPase
MDVARKTNEPFYEAELNRLKGDALVKSGVASPAEAESCFHRAIEIARQQQAKSFELRAAMSLARLWQQQGKREEARTMLEEIYGWFTEGFDTADLNDARVLRDELMDFSLQAGSSEKEGRTTK